MVSPAGSNFYLLSVFNANESFIETGIMEQRYNNDRELWATHRGERMLSWGFNTAAANIPVSAGCRSEPGAARAEIR